MASFSQIQEIYGASSKSHVPLALQGNGLSFNGVNNYLQCNTWSEIPLSREFTMFFVGDPDGSKSRVAVSGNVIDVPSGSPNFQKGIHFYSLIVGRGTQLVLRDRTGAGSRDGISYSNDFPTNKVAQIATYSGDLSAAKIYQGAREQRIILRNTLAPGDSVVNGAGKLAIGAIVADGGVLGGFPLSDLAFKGLMRRYEIADRALTPQEIEKAYNYGSMDAVLNNSEFLLKLDFSTFNASTQQITDLSPNAYVFNAFGASMSLAPFL